MKNLFRHEVVSDRVIRIFDTVGDVIYLIIGDERAAVLDTGYGIGDLKEYVSQFTSLPVTALITHGHRDHAMGAGQFEAWLSPLDREKYISDADPRRRNAGLDRAQEKFDSGLIPWADRPEESDLQPVHDADELKPIYEGKFYDLGGITVEAYNVRGHSDGSMVFLMPELRLLDVGDAIGFVTRIFCTVTEYRDDLKKVQEHCAGRYDSIIGPHGKGTHPMGIIEGALEACEAVLDGTDDKIPFIHPDKEIFGGRDMRYAKEMVKDENGMHRKDGGIGGLVYDSALIK